MKIIDWIYKNAFEIAIWCVVITFIIFNIALLTLK